MKFDVKGVAIAALILLAIIVVMEKLTKFKDVTKPLRRRKGVGDFGAYRSAHPDIPHQGQDFLAVPGQEVFAPISGVVRIARPYKDDSRFSGVEIYGTGGASKVKVFYISPAVAAGETVEAGQPIGTVQDLSVKYGAAFLPQNHVHVEVRRAGVVVNPTGYFGPDTILAV